MSTVWMVELPLPALFLLIVGGWIAFALAGLALTPRLVPAPVLRKHNDVSGFVFGAVGVVYGAALAFVFVLVWEQFSDARRSAAAEAASAVTLLRAFASFESAEDARALNASLLEYARVVIDREFPAVGAQADSPEGRAKILQLWRRVGQLKPASDADGRLHGIALAQLAELQRYRAMRIYAANDDIPAPIWLVILLGGVLTIGHTFMFGAESRRLHRVLATALAGAIGLVVFAIVLLDHPFAGSTRVLPEGYQRLIEHQAETLVSK